MSEKAKNYAVTLLFCGFIGILMLLMLLLPDEDISKSERRKLAQMPALSFKSVASGEFMSGFETYSVDQFPARDSFRRLKAITSFYALGQKDNNGIFIVGGQASRLEYPKNQESMEYAVGRIENIYNLYLKDKDIKTYLCIIPDKNRYIAAENGYPSLDYEDFSKQISSAVSEYAQNIEISDLLEVDDYFSTDIHWRQEKIIDVAQRLAEKMDTPFGKDFEEVTLDIPFWGVYAGQSALPLKADEIKYITSPAIESATAFDYESNAEIPIYSMELAEGRDPYEMYLCGSKSLITIENPDALSDKELVIFRDSFGSTLAPLLIDSYKKITLVDIRYLQSSFVGRFVEFDNQDIGGLDVLFLYSVPVLNNSSTMK